MEVLLTLESVVDNLAECLKNNDLMVFLTRFVSLTEIFSFLKSIHLKHMLHLMPFDDITEPHLQISLPISSSCPTGRAQDSWV